jgi:cell division protein FtsN
MAAKRKKAANRRGSRKKSSGGIPAWFWLLGGILIGLGTAVALMFKGYLPELKQHGPTTTSKAPAEAALVEKANTETAKPKKPRYDFFTVLPEMEVVVPQQQLSREAKPSSDPTPGTAQDKYILQVGSFRNAADAEQMKARLALLGSMATIQTVTVNSQTWHRVRIGPFEGAREADEKRRMLSDSQIDTLVMKVNP